jgi:hypothetical protein
MSKEFHILASTPLRSSPTNGIAGLRGNADVLFLDPLGSLLWELCHFTLRRIFKHGFVMFNFNIQDCWNVSVLPTELCTVLTIVQDMA